MTEIIYQYTLKSDENQVLKLPKDYRILSVQIQHERPQLWVLVNPKNELVDCKIRIRGIGHTVERSELLWHIGTFQLNGGNVVFHAFEEITPSPSIKKDKK